MPELVAELIGLGVNIIVTVGMPAVISATQIGLTIPPEVLSLANRIIRVKGEQ